MLIKILPHIFRHPHNRNTSTLEGLYGNLCFGEPLNTDALVVPGYLLLSRSGSAVFFQEMVPQGDILGLHSMSTSPPSFTSVWLLTGLEPKSGATAGTTSRRERERESQAGLFLSSITHIISIFLSFFHTFFLCLSIRLLFCLCLFPWLSVSLSMCLSFFFFVLSALQSTLFFRDPCIDIQHIHLAYKTVQLRICEGNILINDMVF